MAENCDATNGAGLSNAQTPGSDSSADCSSVMNICSLPTGLSSISPASGSRCANVYETRSSHFYSTHHGKTDIQKDQVRIEVLKFLKGIEPVRRFADDVKFRALLQGGAKKIANRCMIVYQENAN